MTTVLIIGLGSIAKKHINALTQLNIECEIYALRSKYNADVIENVINVLDIKMVIEKIDFAIISNPTNLHAHYIELLAKKSIPLFIEKPPLDTLKNSHELVNVINKVKLTTYVGCNLRFHPCIKFVKNYLDSQHRSINEVNVYCGSYLPDWRPSLNYKDVYSAKKSMGGGVHLDLFHELDYVKWFFDLPRQTSSVKRSRSTLRIDAYDYANYALTYDDFVVNIVLNYYRKDAKRSIEILFEEETWTVDLLLNKIMSSSGRLIYQPATFSILETYKSQLEYFIDCLLHERLPMNTFEESLETLKICLDNE